MFDDMFDFDGDGELDTFEEVGQDTYDEFFDEECDKECNFLDSNEELYDEE